MQKVFPKPVQRRFNPPPPLMSPRVWTGGPVHEQTQSAFLGRLPPELRNEIYSYAFGTTDELGDTPLIEETAKSKEDGITSISSTCSPPIFEEKKKPHPLSLLLTCRKINQEASLLAFAVYTFTITNPSPTFHALRYRTSLLSPAQISALTSLAYCVAEPATASWNYGSSFIANSLLLFPNVTNIKLQMRRSRQVNNRIAFHSQPNWHADWDQRPFRVPFWLFNTLEEVRGGRSFRWQTGEKWSVQWPQEKDGMAAYVEEVHVAYGVSEGGMAMLGVQGVEPCACGCGEPSWVIADLVQETGRIVRVEVIYSGDAMLDKRMEFMAHRVKLIPGTERLHLKSINKGAAWRFERGSGAVGTVGFGWDGEKDFWEGLSWKKVGFWGRLTKGLHRGR